MTRTAFSQLGRASRIPVGSVSRRGPGTKMRAKRFLFFNLKGLLLQLQQCGVPGAAAQHKQVMH
jgi:hypothetical protein